MRTEDIVKELENLPTTVYCGFYQLRITHNLRDEIIKLLERQKPLLPITEGSTEKWDGHLFCRDCGRVVVFGSNFCSHCGRAIRYDD